ncbi:MAG: hypothetical protein NTW28_29750 [Candidatus Solibacter sp.]|nr:hypothetical protein [Candidatus Solibacter sp.]
MNSSRKLLALLMVAVLLLAAFTPAGFALSAAVLCGGCMMGVAMRPDEIEELMRVMNQPKIVRMYAEEDDKGGGDPPGEPILESRTS